MIYFDAPWSTKLKLITAFVTVLLLAIPARAWFNSSTPVEGISLFVTLLAPIVLIAGGYLYSIKRYGLSSTEIVVERPIGSKRFPLNELESAAFDPIQTAGSLRIFGNGGFYSFSGYFQNARLGRYRAYMMNRDHAVILTFPKAVVVISPKDPAAFVEQVNSLLHS